MDGRKARRSAAGWKRHLVVIGAYALMALLLTYPLGLHFLSHVPGDGGDDPALAWNLWWVPYSLLQLRANPFACDYMFYPIGINLAFYTLTIFNAFLSTPLQAIIDLVPVSNVVLLSSFVLSGYGAFLLVEYLLVGIGSRGTGSGWAAFVAGFVYAFSSSKLFYAALGQFNIASSQWIPFYVLFLLKLRREPSRWRYGLLAGLFMLFQGLAELTYASFLVVFTVVYLVWHAVTKWRSVLNVTFIGGLVIAAVVTLIGLSPTVAMMIPDLQAEGDFSVQGSGFAETFSADALGFFVPTMHHPLLGSLVERFNFPHEKAQHLYLGYVVLALALYAVFRLRRYRVVQFWAVSAGIFFLLCLGPSLRVNGVEIGIPLPFRVLQQLPLFKANRYPSRFGVLLVLSLAVLVGYGVSLLVTRYSLLVTRRWLLATGCWLLITFEHLSLPLPLSDFRVPDVYHAIAAEPDDFTVLDLPLAWRNGFRITGPLDSIFMFEQWYQTAHHKRLLSGNTSRNPEFKFQYFTEAPIINSLLMLELGHPVDEGMAERDRGLAPEVLHFFNVRYVVVHTAHVGPGLVPYIETTFPVNKIHDGDGIVAYRVELPEPPAGQMIDLGGELGRLHMAEGWAVPTGEWVWAQRQGARLLLRLEEGGAYRVSMRLFSPVAEYWLYPELNGVRLSRLTLDKGWVETSFHLPAKHVRPGLNELRWYGFPQRLLEVGAFRLGALDVGTTGVASPVDVTVVSAGMDVGDLGHIYVAGRDVSLGGIGYNLAVIHAATGEVEAVASFNTFASPEESAHLARWVADIPSGRIVAVAVRDEASRHLTGEAAAALRTLGLVGDLRDRWRWSHAAIGVKGASPGQAVEMISGIRPAVAVVGEGATEAGLAAAFDWIRLEPVESR